MNNKWRLLIILSIVLLAVSVQAFAAPINVPNIEVNIGDGDGGLSSTIQVIILMTILTLAPAILIMMTSFTRIIIILSFLRKALALQTTPPNQIIIGLALFLTFFVMSPVFATIYNDAYIPLSEGTIDQNQAYQNAMAPLRSFMFKQVRSEDLALFVNIAQGEAVTSLDQVSDVALIPAFIISELKTGFIIGFLLFIPFIVIDMVVASTLMALGMMMLPPVMISLPFKLLLFILVDGWNLLIKAILAGFNL